MKKIDEKLNQFINSNKKTLLVSGDWGVGKTYSVNNWLESKSFKDTKRNLIKLSLFGISSTNDLYTRLIEESCKFYKIKKVIKSLIPGISYTSPVGIGFSLELSGLFNLIINTNEYKDSKNLIVIDDIERKDNNLSIFEILGFVDYLPGDNTKVILIANSEEFDKDSKDDFKKFKEKVINDEICILEPDEGAKKDCLSSDFYEKLNLNGVNNLRTIITLSDIIKSNNFELNDKNILIAQICLYSLQYLSLSKFTRDEFIINEINKELKQQAFFFSSKQKDRETISKEVTAKYSTQNYSDDEIFVLMVKYDPLFNKLKNSNVNELIMSILTSVKNRSFDNLSNIKVNLMSDELSKKIFKLNFADIFYSADHQGKIALYINKIASICDNDDYDVPTVFEQFLLLYCFYTRVKENYSKKNIQAINSVKTKFIPFVSRKIYQNPDYFYDSFSLVNDQILSFKEGVKFIDEIINKIKHRYQKYFLEELHNNIKKMTLNLQNLKEKLDAAHSLFEYKTLFQTEKEIRSLRITLLEFYTQNAYLLDYDLQEETWSLFHSFSNWCKQLNIKNKYTDSFFKTLINKQKTKVGKNRLTILINQYFS